MYDEITMLLGQAIEAVPSHEVELLIFLCGAHEFVAELRRTRLHQVFDRLVNLLATAHDLPAPVLPPSTRDRLGQPGDRGDIGGVLALELAEGDVYDVLDVLGIGIGRGDIADSPAGRLTHRIGYLGVEGGLVQPPR